MPSALPRPAGARAVLFASAGALCAACAGSGSDGGPLRIETGKEIVRADEPTVEATGNSARVVVHGAPLDGASADAVASALVLPQKVGGARFRPTQPDDPGPRLSLAFTGMAAEELCSGASPSPPAADPPRVSAAWCLGDRVIGTSTASGGALRGPSDPGFARAMRSVLNSFLAPNRKGGGVGGG